MNGKISIEPQSVKSLFVQMYFNEIQLGSGTAFIVKKDDDNILITAKHNLTGRHFETNECLSEEKAVPNKLVIFHHVKNKLGEWAKQTYSLYKDMDNCSEPIFLTHDSADVAALTIDCGQYEVYSYDVYFEPKIRIMPAESVSVIGFPFGLRHGGYLGLWVSGTIASEPEIDYDEMPCFLIDCRTRKGQSGSPVIVCKKGMYKDKQGNTNIITGDITELLGIYTGRINIESDLGYVWKLKAVHQLLEAL